MRIVGESVLNIDSFIALPILAVRFAFEDTMPNTKSAIKRARSTAKREARNKSVKSRLKTLERRFLQTLEQGSIADAEVALRSTASALGKAAKGGVIPAATANRKRSRLHLRLNAKQATTV